MGPNKSQCRAIERLTSGWQRRFFERPNKIQVNKLMHFEIQTIKDGKFWLIEAPALDVMTQGRTKKEAYEMLADAVELLVNDPDFKVKVHVASKGQDVTLSANDPDQLIALMLRRQREKYGLTLQELAERLGSKSPNTFARYEQGKARPTLSKLLELIEAIDPELAPILKLAA